MTDLKKQTLEPKFQIELDKLKLEKAKLKAQNYKKLIEDIENQKNLVSTSLSQEKDDNIKLKQKLEETNILYRTV